MALTVNPPPGRGPGRPRLYIAFFNHPNYDVLIECLVPPGEAKQEPVLSGAYRNLKKCPRQTGGVITVRSTRTFA
jgi:hypothetical protein